jgi:inositol-phosphate transport system ATP-binding protein
MRTEIKSLQKKLGVTTVLVTHDQIEATTMADRIICERKGDGPPRTPRGPSPCR